MDIELVKNTLKTLVSDRRYEHSVRVAELAQALAKHYKENELSAYLAGLVHDCAKDMTPQSSILEFSDQHEQLFKDYPAIWHAQVVPVVAAHYFMGLESDVIQAATSHTTGRAAMSNLEKIVFIADFCEPGRSFSQRKELEHLAFDSLDTTVLEIASLILARLIQQKRSIHPNLLSCYNFYQKRYS